MTTIQPITRSLTPVAAKVMENASGNILFRIQALVCRINTQLSRLSQETQSRSQTMKKEYRVASEKSADLTKEIGTWAPLISGGALAVSLFTPWLENPIAKHLKLNDSQKETLNKVLIHKLPDLVSGLGQYKTGGLNAEQTKQGSISTLRNTEISNEGQKTGESQTLQSNLEQLLANIRDLFKKASS